MSRESPTPREIITFQDGIESVREWDDRFAPLGIPFAHILGKISSAATAVNVIAEMLLGDEDSACAAGEHSTIYEYVRFNNRQKNGLLRGVLHLSQSINEDMESMENCARKRCEGPSNE